MSEILTCSHCHATVEQTDNYCRVCGKSLKQGYSFWFTHTGIILMALVVGPFALPCVWMSKVIGPIAKWIYSLFLLLMGYYLVMMCYRLFTLVQTSMSLLTNGL